ncbi:hypothetical protein GY45DRAFT_1347238 [Cubamyces sp. BRFM 1775]|nr:hypothetical protein GY45DRAFT_1347238 [Cubamyces sp. BRFM 1775]
MAESRSLCIAVLGTCDTKLDELLYVHKLITKTHHLHAMLVDVGRTAGTHPAISTTQATILATTPSNSLHLHPIPDVRALSRNDLVTAIVARARPLLASLAASHHIHAIVALGGSGGSTLAADVFAAFWAAPLGAMASGDLNPFVKDADVAVMYSVVDIAGLNNILCPILDNAAAAVAGMACSRSQTSASRRKRIAIMMFGVTTPAVTHARELLAKYDCTPYLFHATGAGGRAMERLVSEGFFDGVLDLTAMELEDELVGGVLSAGPHRLEAAAGKGVPSVGCRGHTCHGQFRTASSVPEKWTREEGEGKRKLYEHNPSVTLMRTTGGECAQLGKIIVEQLRYADPEITEVWLPRGGISAMDVEGGPFEDRIADRVQLCNRRRLSTFQQSLVVQ